MLSFLLSACATLHTKEVDYSANGQVLKGYIAYDKKIKGKRPGVLVVHEWWGHNEYARKRARMLADLGYTAFALDMYGDGKQAAHPNEAGKFAEEVSTNKDKAEKRFLAALDLLRLHETVNPDQIAAIGYCFGGGVVLHGADDPFITPEQVEQFKQEMKRAGVDYKFVAYPGVKHSFTNPEADSYGEKFNLPLKYDLEADNQCRYFSSFYSKNDRDVFIDCLLISPAYRTE